MSVMKLRGIVLKEELSGEANKRIIIFSKDTGRCMISAKGARKSKSPFLAGTQIFSYCDFYVYEGRGFLSLTQIDIIDSFYGVRNDIQKLSYAVYFADIINRTLLEGIENNEILILLLSVLDVFSKTDFNVILAARIFEIKYLQLSGFMPDIIHCNSCGKNIEKQVHFQSEKAAFLCQNCKRTVEISSGTLEALKYIFLKKGRKLFSFDVSSVVLNELSIISKSFMNLYIGEDFKTLKFAENINSLI